MKDFIKKTLEEAGRGVMQYYGSREVLYTKDREVDVVTKADLESNRIIVEAIKRVFPDDGIVSEEDEGYQLDADRCWHIDPLDGTRNFSTTVPLFGINLAVADNRIVTYAATYLPLTKELSYAEKGKGAYLNDERVYCSDKESWEHTYGLIPITGSPQNLSIKGKIHDLSNQTAWMGAIASPAVCGALVSTGRRDWYFTPNQNSWDIAACSLIAKESGAVVTNLDGGEYKIGDRGLVIANDKLHPDLLKLVQGCYD